MDHAAFQPDHGDQSAETGDARAAPRVTLLIRAAKLGTPQGEFVCVIRDVSTLGVSVRLFHQPPICDDYELELQSGQTYRLERIWEKERELGFAFCEKIDVDKVINETGVHRKRGLRLGLEFPVTLQTLAARYSGTVVNLSQQGARIESNALLALDQSLRVEGHGLRDLRAKVRWRKGCEYGLVFDDTLSLADFACLAARLQRPDLLRP